MKVRPPISRPEIEFQYAEALQQLMAREKLTVEGLARRIHKPVKWVQTKLDVLTEVVR